MSALTRLALTLLQSPTTPPGLRAVACATLLSAMEHAIEVPNESHMAAWRYLLGSDASAAAMHGHQLVHPEVARDALRVLRDPQAGEAAQDLALATLRGDNVLGVEERDLLSLANRVLDEGRVRRVVWLVEQVHEVRGLDPDLLRTLRSHLARSNDGAARSGAVAVARLLPQLEEEFFIEMLNDPSPIVRAAVADNLESVEEPAREKALLLLRAQLARETHRSVLSALHFALASLVRAQVRHERRWGASADRH